jgi:hypothetical protein
MGVIFAIASGTRLFDITLPVLLGLSNKRSSRSRCGSDNLDRAG